MSDVKILTFIISFTLFLGFMIPAITGTPTGSGIDINEIQQPAGGIGGGFFDSIHSIMSLLIDMLLFNSGIFLLDSFITPIIYIIIIYLILRLAIPG